MTITNTSIGKVVSAAVAAVVLSTVVVGGTVAPAQASTVTKIAGQSNG